jgi:L,D-transpeptidase YbiS
VGLLVVALLALALVLVVIVLLLLGDGISVVSVAASSSLCASHGSGQTSAEAAMAAELRASRQLKALLPTGVYLVVDSAHNRLRVYDGPRLLRDAVCSTGSGTVLREPSGRRVWTFDTPLGERRVVRKVRSPVWSKPDWAFIEEGFEPPRDPSLRIDPVSLGDYALYLGDGYIIHGTLFQTLLGRGVTHGCVRLGDEDLEYVFRTTPVGARVLLY